MPAWKVSSVWTPGSSSHYQNTSTLYNHPPPTPCQVVVFGLILVFSLLSLMQMAQKLASQLVWSLMWNFFPPGTRQASNCSNMNLYFTSLKKELSRTNVSLCSISSEIPIKSKCRQELEINVYIPFQSHWTSIYHKHLLQLLKNIMYYQLILS